MKLNRARFLGIAIGLAICLPLAMHAQQSAEPDDPVLLHRSTVKPSTEQKQPNQGRVIEHVTNFEAQPVTVAGLEQILSALQHKSDKDAARQLSALQSTERLDNTKLAKWKAALRGPKTKSALTALADAAVFLDLPAGEIPDLPAPDLPEQRRIVSLAVDYLGKIIPRLPDFSATRTTYRFDDTRSNASKPNRQSPTGQPLHLASVTSSIVLYRDGKEQVNPLPGKGRELVALNQGLVTRGTFGPILSTVMVDASHGQMAFDHWEQSANGPLAVFDFSVPLSQSHYQVAYQSPADSEQAWDMQHVAAYRGEMAIETAAGTILRLTIQADLAPGLSIERADILVEYGPVEIGGKFYTCPIRSVAFSKGRAVLSIDSSLGLGSALGPDITRLNDVVFTNYHIFRGEVRMLTGDDLPPPQQ